MTSILTTVVQALAIIVFVNRYVAGVIFRVLRGRKFDETVDDFEPDVCIVVPMFNEGESIRATIESLRAQRYPREKLSVIIVDDCSTDDSFQHATVAAAGDPRVRVVKNRVNLGKRRSINRAVRSTGAEIIVSVDSDVVVEPEAVRELVRRFVSPRIAAVGGRVDIRNKDVNWLTKMQTVKYFYGYGFLKNLERSFRSVLCLSGCLTAYRRSVLLELEPLLEKRSILGVPIKYGEDRFLTRQIVKAGYQTTLTLDAVCRTFAPASLDIYFAQQLRWRRSNLIDYVSGISHVWKLNPVVAIHYFALFGLLIAYPALIVQSLLTGGFFQLMLFHLSIVAGLGLYYRFANRERPESEKVSAWAFLPIALVMTVTYAILTPLALFTLDSGQWETRGHEDQEAKLATIEALPSAEVDLAGEAKAAVARAKVRAA